MAPVMIAPPMMPAATPGPHPPRRRHWASASVAVAASVPAMIAAAVRAVRVFFMLVSSKIDRVGKIARKWSRMSHLRSTINLSEF